MQIKFLTVAQNELDDAVTYYNYEQKELGSRFLNETLKSIEHIRNFPEAWQPLSKNTRRIRINHFPYGIIYHIKEHTILIIAIANLHRKPNYWKNRF